MDVLAWVIVICFVSFALLPAIVDFFSVSHMDYKDCWIAGNGTVALIAVFVAVMGGVVWAFDRVIW